MFEQQTIYDIRTNFTLNEINQGIKEIDTHVENEWLGTEDESNSKIYLGDSSIDKIEKEGFWLIPMGDRGVAFDYGDTASDGIPLTNCVPYGDSKEEFKTNLLANLHGVKEILEN